MTVREYVRVSARACVCVVRAACMCGRPCVCVRACARGVGVGGVGGGVFFKGVFRLAGKKQRKQTKS